MLCCIIGNRNIDLSYLFNLQFLEQNVVRLFFVSLIVLLHSFLKTL